MKIYKRMEEVLADVKNNVLELDCDVTFEFPLAAELSLKIAGDISALGNISAWNISAAGNISAWNISAGDISAGDISAGDISAENISAENISAENISAWNISAGDISAGDISAENISAENISAGNISAENISAENIRYYAVCFAYQNIVCLSITGKRDNCRHFCLDGKIELKKREGI